MSAAGPDPQQRREVEAAYPQLAGARWRSVGHGLIHRTFEVAGPSGRFVVQWVREIFGPEVCEDIEAVTHHLAAKGRATPRLCRTREGAFYTQVGGTVVRVLSYVPGATFDRVQDLLQAEAAGRALGRLHADLSDLDHRFRSVRVAHDPARHVAAMARAVDGARGHRLYEAAARLRDGIAAAAEDLPVLDEHPDRVVHGDPKISNLRFAGAAAPGAHEPVAWVDLDTFGRQKVLYEVGDALRSWCNRAGEEDAAARLDLAWYRAALAAYVRSAPPLAGEERALLHRGVEIVALELAARFLKDAVEERYFGWDPSRYPAPGEHQLVRARGQWALYRAAIATRAARERSLDDLVG